MAGRPHLFPYLRLCVLIGAASQTFVTAEQTGLPAHGARATVRFDLYGGYLIVVRGSATGTAAGSDRHLTDLNFLVDTGTSVPIFDAQVAQTLHLTSDAPTNIVILGGRARGANATLPALEVGPVQQSNLPIITTDLSFFRRMLPVRIDAIVGLNVVGQQPFVIDYQAQVIRFGPLPSLAFSIPIKLDGGLATFDAEIDHAPVHLVFDTGVGSVVLFDPTIADASRTKPDFARDTKDVGNFTSQVKRLQTIRLGDKRYRPKSALLVSNPKQSQLDFDGLMSPPALGISQVSVDLKRGLLAFSR